MSEAVLKLQDFCDMDSLYDILDNWSKCTGLSAVVVDTCGNAISKSFGFSPFCKMIQDTPEGLKRCRTHMSSGNEGIHECHAGFIDFAVPVALPDGTVLGRVFAGQMCIEGQGQETILEKIRDIGVDELNAAMIFNELPKKNRTELEGSYNLLKQMICFFIEKSYSSFKEVAARRFDVTMLTTALKTVYRMSIYFNLSKNEYHLIDYTEGVSKVVPVKGTIDDIVRIGVKSIPDEKQAQEYYNKFNRQALIDACKSGVKDVSLQHRQSIFNGEAHWMEARAVFIESPDEDLHAICLSRLIDDDVKNKLILNDALAHSKEQQILLQQALDNYKQADYDRKRDFLTGLRNRQDMFCILNDSSSGKKDSICSMYMMDIDSFKALNDRYGHTYGDDCLKKIGEALNEYASKNNMYFFRYGGEEILGISFDKEMNAQLTGEELVKLVSDLNIKRDDTASGIVTVSVGYTTDNSSIEKMIDKADKAMYKAKERGKNQSVCFETINI